MSRSLSIRAMLIGLFMVAAIGAVVLAATGLVTQQRLIESQRLMTGEVLPDQAANRDMVLALGAFSQRHTALLAAESDQALDAVTARSGLDERFAEARERLNAGNGLDENYQALLDADAALEAARRQALALQADMARRLDERQAQISEAVTSIEHMAERAALADMGQRQALLDQVDAWRDEGMTSLPTALLDSLLGDSATFGQIGSDLDSVVTSLAELGRQDSVESLRLEQLELRGQVQSALDTITSATADMHAVLDEIEARTRERAELAATQAETLANAGRILLIVVALAMLLLLAVFGWRTLTRLLEPLSQMRQQMANISGAAGQSGNLSKRLDISRHDEVGRTVLAFNQMMDAFERIVAQIRDGAVAIAASSRQISSGNDDLSQRTEEQSLSLAETASSLERVTVTVRQTSDYARQARALSGDVDQRARMAGEVAERTNLAMSDIRHSSEQITGIVKAIDDIAFQTNLLALNASVEAARAGEQGRGFAVVAGEVRSLAQRSAAEAAQIRKLVQNSVAKVGEGAKLVGSTSDHLHEISQSLGEVNRFVGEIADAIQEQSLGIEQINQAISQLDQVTQRNARLVEEACSSSRILDDRAAEMHDLVGRFRVSDHLGSGISWQAALPDPQASARES